MSVNRKIKEDLEREYARAVELHPDFPPGRGAIAIIAEELGELAKELNDHYDCVPGALGRAYTEAGHVVITAVRTMVALAEERERWAE